MNLQLWSAFVTMNKTESELINSTLEQNSTSNGIGNETGTLSFDPPLFPSPRLGHSAVVYNVRIN